MEIVENPRNFQTLVRLTSAVPAALHGFRVECHNDAKLLGDAPQDVPRDPEIVGCLHAERRTDLIFCGRRNLIKLSRGVCLNLPHCAGITSALVPAK